MTAVRSSGNLHRGRLGAALAATLALLAVLLGTAAQGRAEGSSAAVESIASCFAERQHLAVLLLIDESGSLQRTDPDNERVIALRAALETLESVRSLAGEDARLDIALSAFATQYTLVRDWTPLDQTTLSQLRADADGFAERNRGLDTDFALALDGASDELDRYAGRVLESGEELPCRAVLMFTDGDYDIEPRNQPETRPYAPGLPLDVPGNADLVEAAGRAYVCEDGGAIDRLRATDAPLITVAFTPDISPEDRAFIQALSVGTANGITCGSDQRGGLGAYVEAEDLDALIRAFHSIIGQSANAAPLLPERELEVCDGAACSEGRFEFELDGSLRRAHLLANLVADGIVLQLEGPGAGPPLVIDSDAGGTAELSGAGVLVSPLSPTDLTIELELPSDTDAWIGTWAATFIDTTGRNAGAVASAQLLLFGGLDPEIVGEPSLRLGEAGEIEIGLVNQDGTPRVPEDLLGEVDLTATVTEPLTGRQETVEVSGPHADGRWTVQYTPPTDLGSTVVNLSATLQITTPTGLALQPRTVIRAIPVLPPVTFPRVEPETLDLGTLLGAGTATGSLTVIGGAEQSGCVWFAPGPVDAPRYAGEVTITVDPAATSQADCLQLGPDQSERVEVRAELETVDSGTVRFPIQVFLTSDASTEVLEVGLPASLALVREVDQLRRVGLFAALLLPALLLPLFLMYLFGWWSARFVQPGYCWHATFPVRLREGADLERRAASGEWKPFVLRPEDFKAWDAPDDDVRRFDAAGLSFRARIPINPFGSPYATVSAVGADVVGSSGTTASGDQLAGLSAFGLGGSWALVVGDSGNPTLKDEEWVPPEQAGGQLHIWRPEGTFEAHGKKLEARVLDELPGLLLRYLQDHVPVADVAEDHGAAPEAEPGGYAPPRSSKGSATSPAAGDRGSDATHGGYQPPQSRPSAAPRSPGPAPPTSPGRSDSSSTGWHPPSADDRDDDPPEWKPPSER